MARYGKLNKGSVRADSKPSFLQQALLFLFFFVVSFLILTVVVFYGPFRNNVQQEDDTLRFSAEDLAEEVSEVTAFTDMDEDDAGYLEAMYLKKMGVLKGYKDGSFAPDQKINRAEFVKVVHEAMHVYPHSLRYSYCFGDVQKDWYAPYVCSAKAKAWVSGDAENFVPDREISLAEVVKIIMTVSEIDVEEVVDGPWYDPYMMAATDMEWFDMAKITDTDPERPVLRTEVARLLYFPVRSGLIK